MVHAVMTCEHVNVGLLGQLPVMVNTENGPIEPGDYLTCLQLQKAMKAVEAGLVLGIAYESYNDIGTGLL